MKNKIFNRKDKLNSIFPDKSNRIKYIHRSFKRMRFLNNSFHSKIQNSRPEWKTITFPENVRLISEPDEAMKYFNQAYKYFRKNKNVKFDLSKVNHFSPESIALFTACCADKRYTQNMLAVGNLPKSYILRKLFLESGFFDHVNLRNSKIGAKTKETNRLLHNRTDNEVETAIAKEVCLLVQEKIGAEYIDDMEPLYVTLIEAMQNTNNHASGEEEKRGKYDWWLYRYEDKGAGMIHFTFLDIGIGVFNSLSVRNWGRKLLEAAKFTSNLDLVDDLLDGKIRSRTLRPDRGKGIPQIYDSSSDSMFNEFYILSNDILIDAKNNNRTLLKEEFHGTMYYWTIKVKSYGN